MLRGMYYGNNLKFDAQGNLVGAANTVPFSLSALRLDKVKMRGSEVELDVTREGLTILARVTPTDAHIDAKTGKLVGALRTWSSTPQQVSAEPWNKHDGAKIEIALDLQHPEALDTALGNVFAVGLDERLAESAPEYWRPWLQQEIDPKAGAEPSPAEQKLPCADMKKVCPGVTPPRLIHSTDPKFSEVARKRKYSGICVVGMTVDRAGMPSDVHIVRALGMGLDEQAVAAVERYRFRPATYKGEPVPVRINIEVNFRIW